MLKLVRKTTNMLETKIDSKHENLWIDGLRFVESLLHSQPFENPVFSMNPYREGDETANFTFKQYDFGITWYKHIGRGMTFTHDYNAKIIGKIITECLISIIDDFDAEWIHYVADRYI